MENSIHLFLKPLLKQHKLLWKKGGIAPLASYIPLPLFKNDHSNGQATFYNLVQFSALSTQLCLCWFSLLASWQQQEPTCLFPLKVDEPARPDERLQPARHNWWIMRERSCNAAHSFGGCQEFHTLVGIGQNWQKTQCSTRMLSPENQPLRVHNSKLQSKSLMKGPVSKVWNECSM